MAKTFISVKKGEVIGAALITLIGGIWIGAAFTNLYHLNQTQTKTSAPVVAPQKPQPAFTSPQDSTATLWLSGITDMGIKVDTGYDRIFYTVEANHLRVEYTYRPYKPYVQEESWFFSAKDITGKIVFTSLWDISPATKQKVIDLVKIAKK